MWFAPALGAVDGLALAGSPWTPHSCFFDPLRLAERGMVLFHGLCLVSLGQEEGFFRLAEGL